MTEPDRKAMALAYAEQVQELRTACEALDNCPECELHHPWICAECGERLA